MLKSARDILRSLSQRNTHHEALSRSLALLAEADAMLDQCGDYRTRGLQIRIKHHLQSMAWVDTKPEGGS